MKKHKTSSKKALNKAQINSLMYARHTMATTLNIAGEPISKISEVMGHTSPKAIEAYIASIEDVKRKTY